MTGIDGSNATWAEAEAECLVYDRVPCAMQQIQAGQGCTFAAKQHGQVLLWTSDTCKERVVDRSMYTSVYTLGKCQKQNATELTTPYSASLADCLQHCRAYGAACATVAYNFKWTTCKLLQACRSERIGFRSGICEHWWMTRRYYMRIFARRMERASQRVRASYMSQYCHYTTGERNFSAAEMRFELDRRAQVKAAERPRPPICAARPRPMAFTANQGRQVRFALLSRKTPSCCFLGRGGHHHGECESICRADPTCIQYATTIEAKGAACKICPRCTASEATRKRRHAWLVYQKFLPGKWATDARVNAAAEAYVAAAGFATSVLDVDQALKLLLPDSLPEAVYMLEFTGRLSGTTARYFSLADMRRYVRKGWQLGGDHSGIFMVGRTAGDTIDSRWLYTVKVDLRVAADVTGELLVVTDVALGEPLINRSAYDISHSMGTTVVRQSDGSATLYGVGGQYRHPKIRYEMALGAKPNERHDGLYLLAARNASDLLRGGWFPFTEGTFGYRNSKRTASGALQASTGDGSPRVPRVLDGVHDSCVECRHGTHESCEFDGKISMTRFKNRYLIYARANTNTGKGGRYVQVTSSERDDPAGPYGPFHLLSIMGYSAIKQGNIYFAAVQPNPVDEERTLLGLFPVAMDVQVPHIHAPGSRGTATGERRPSNLTLSQDEGFNGFIGVSISCDGVVWAPLVVLAISRVSQSRTWDQPVDGFLKHGDNVFAFIHTNVPGIPSNPKARPGLVQVCLTDNALLERLTRAAHAHLPGCA